MPSDKCRSCDACGRSFVPVVANARKGRSQRFCSPACGRTAGAPRKFSDAQEQEIAERYSAGESATRLAAEFGCWQTTISKLLRRRGVPTRGGVTQHDRDGMTTMWREGAALSVIGKQYKRAPSTVAAILEQAGVRNITLRRSTGTRHPSWAGGKSITPAGYVLAHVNDDDPYAVMRASKSRYVFEHRLVMARSLGRPLRKGETVHHINGDRADNRLENLQLRHGRHGKGQAMCCADCGSRNVVPAPLG